MVLSLGISHAQQSPQFTNYIWNPVLQNAAYLGTLEGFHFTGMYRSPWTGIENAPRILSFVAEQGLSESAGLALSILNDDFGPTANTDISVHYSYGISLNGALKMRFSLSAIATFFTLDTDGIVVADPQELILEGLDSEFSPNFGAGLLLYSEKWFIGLSAPALFPVLHSSDSNDFRTRNTQLNMTGGFMLASGPDWAIRPSFLLQKEFQNPLVVNLTATVFFKNRLSFGVNYSKDVAVSGLMGFWINDRIGVGYSYDFPISDLDSVVGGGHEIFLRFGLHTINGNNSALLRN